MQLVFRKLPPAESLVPQPGEIYLLPVPEQRPRNDLANLVLEKGSACLLRGPDLPRRLVIDADPKFDDMLAALFAQRQIERQPLATGCQAFARYAALLQEGIRPTNLPLEDSLEGIFLALRGAIEKPLTDEEATKQFVEAWRRLAEVILTAAEQNLDPFTESLFGTEAGPEYAYSLRSINRGDQNGARKADFTAEQSFLLRDLDVYREDVAQGEKWRVRLPGAPAPAHGLLLRRPKSLLMKYWTRSPCPAPLGGPYQFLAIAQGEGQWMFSTNPADKVSLQPLAELLDKNERKQAPAADAWFDGKPHYRLVGAPRGGTRLAEDRVLGIVKKWCRASPADKPSRTLRFAAIGAGLAALAVAAFFFFARPGPVEKFEPLDIHDVYILAVGVSEYKDLNGLPNAAKDATAVLQAFKKLEGPLWQKVTVKPLLNEQATRGNILDTGLASWLLEQPVTKHSLAIVHFSGHGLVEEISKRYQFAPYDYDRLNKGSTGIFLADLQRYLANLPCPVLLIFDTCHSGALDEGEDEADESPDKVLKSIQKSVSDTGSRHGLIVMAACARYQKANETDRWGHGALTLALLEGITGKRYYQAKGLYETPLPKPGDKNMVMLDDVDHYVSDRVEVLSSEISTAKYRRQAARTFATGNISPKQIPITVYAGK